MKIGDKNMILNNLKLLVRLKKYLMNSNEFLDSIPNEISAAFFDNSHVNNVFTMVGELIKAHFGADAEEVFWFLYEWDGKEQTTVFDFNNKEHVVNSIDEYIEFLKISYKDR